MGLIPQVSGRIYHFRVDRKKCTVSAHDHPFLSDKFCFSCVVDGAIVSFNEFTRRPYLKGEFPSVRAAILAGVDYAREWEAGE